jgi:high-affinity Fe2+/Pb2+ permease
MEHAEKRWQAFGFSIVLFAALLLTYGLYRLRLQRIANTGTEFFTGFFLILIIATIITYALLLLALWRYQKQLSPAMSIGIFIGTLIGW